MATVTIKFIYTFNDSNGSLQFVEKCVSIVNLEWDYKNNRWDDSEDIGMSCLTFAPYNFTSSKKLQISTKFKQDKLYILVKQFKFELSMGFDNILRIKVYSITGDGDWNKQYSFAHIFGDCNLYVLTEEEFDLP